ncbi:MAG: FAD-dependent oxidoreductase, partial [Acidimicrobiia bacterium]|nr:FAD-dependent oxidoreductase [Acidimicrobiia bacterium]
ELTHGSTWHSAGGMHTLNGDPNVAALQKYTVELYKEIEAISGQNCGIHLTGGLVLADSEERMDFLRMANARARYLNMESHLLSAEEAHEMVPFLEPKFFVGAMYDAHEGHVDPSGVTHAYAKAAQLAGAEVYKNTWAHAITPAPDHSWDIHLHDTRNDQDLGSIRCEHFVNAGGLWAREVGRMTGIEIPVLAMEHMYLLTEAVPELADWRATSSLPGFHVVDLGGEIYMREEGDGLLLGTYEPNGVPWSPQTTPWDFGAQLLPPDLDRIADNLDVGFQHFPIFNEIGIKQTINGPFTFAPDGNPLIGPVHRQPGHWLACGVMAGLSQGGGVGLAMANWMTEGDPSFDVWGMDNARFGDWATPRYTSAKVVENYGRRFRITFPNEELPAGRNHQTSPIHDRMAAHNAVFGAAYGLEYPLWFQTEGAEPVEEVTFHRSNAFGPVAGEVAAVRNGVGMLETTGYAKYEVQGPGARAWLESMLPNRAPNVGRMVLSPMLNQNGMLIGDFTVAALPADRFMIFGSGIAERYHERWFEAHLPADRSVSFRTCGNELTGLSVAGPRSRELLQGLIDFDLDDFSFRDFTETSVGQVPVELGRLTFTGDLGYEIWCAASYQQQLFDTLMDRGRPFDLQLFGIRALDSMRLEKGWGSWATEYRPIYNPYEANMGWMVKLDKDFIGRDAATEIHAQGPTRKLVLFSVDVGTGNSVADCIGDEPIWHDGAVVGWITSGGYAHHTELSLALGYVPIGIADAQSGFEIEVVGQRRPAQLLTDVPFDPSGSRMRA